eukprot:2019503-Pleurochrysis_carterae.AAC.4
MIACVRSLMRACRSVLVRACARARTCARACVPTCAAREGVGVRASMSTPLVLSVSAYAIRSHAAVRPQIEGPAFEHA